MDDHASHSMLGFLCDAAEEASPITISSSADEARPKAATTTATDTTATTTATKNHRKSTLHPPALPSYHHNPPPLLSPSPSHLQSLLLHSLPPSFTLPLPFLFPSGCHMCGNLRTPHFLCTNCPTMVHLDPFKPNLYPPLTYDDPSLPPSLSPSLPPSLPHSLPPRPSYVTIATRR